MTIDLDMDEGTVSVSDDYLKEKLMEVRDLSNLIMEVGSQKIDGSGKDYSLGVSVGAHIALAWMIGNELPAGPRAREVLDHLNLAFEGIFGVRLTMILRKKAETEVMN